MTLVRVIENVSVSEHHSRQSKIGMELQPAGFGSGTHIPLMGSPFADFQVTGEGASARRWDRQDTQVGCGCFVQHYSLVCGAGGGVGGERTKHVCNLIALMCPPAQEPK